MSAIEEYLEEFYNNNKIEEYKINVLKNHYFDNINKILKTTRDNFRIGVTKNRNLVWFATNTDTNVDIIYNHTTNEYFKKNNDKIIKINIEDYNTNENEREIEREFDNKKCNLKICILL